MADKKVTGQALDSGLAGFNDLRELEKAGFASVTSELYNEIGVPQDAYMTDLKMADKRGVLENSGRIRVINYDAYSYAHFFTSPDSGGGVVYVDGVWFETYSSSEIEFIITYANEHNGNFPQGYSRSDFQETTVAGEKIYYKPSKRLSGWYPDDLKFRLTADGRIQYISLGYGESQSWDGGDQQIVAAGDQGVGQAAFDALKGYLSASGGNSRDGVQIKSYYDAYIAQYAEMHKQIVKAQELSAKIKALAPEYQKKFQELPAGSNFDFGLDNILSGMSDSEKEAAFEVMQRNGWIPEGRQLVKKPEKGTDAEGSPVDIVKFKVKLTREEALEFLAKASSGTVTLDFTKAVDGIGGGTDESAMVAMIRFGWFKEATGVDIKKHTATFATKETAASSIELAFRTNKAPLASKGFADPLLRSISYYFSEGKMPNNWNDAATLKDDAYVSTKFIWGLWDKLGGQAGGAVDTQSYITATRPDLVNGRTQNVPIEFGNWEEKKKHLDEVGVSAQNYRFFAVVYDDVSKKPGLVEISAGISEQGAPIPISNYEKVDTISLSRDAVVDGRPTTVEDRLLTAAEFQTLINNLGSTITHDGMVFHNTSEYLFLSKTDTGANIPVFAVSRAYQSYTTVAYSRSQSRETTEAAIINDPNFDYGNPSHPLKVPLKHGEKYEQVQAEFNDEVQTGLDVGELSREKAYFTTEQVDFLTALLQGIMADDGQYLYLSDQDRPIQIDDPESDKKIWAHTLELSLIPSQAMSIILKIDEQLTNPDLGDKAYPADYYTIDNKKYWLSDNAESAEAWKDPLGHDDLTVQIGNFAMPRKLAANLANIMRVYLQDHKLFGLSQSDMLRIQQAMQAEALNEQMEASRKMANEQMIYTGLLFGLALPTMQMLIQALMLKWRWYRNTQIDFAVEIQRKSMEAASEGEGAKEDLGEGADFWAQYATDMREHVAKEYPEGTGIVGRDGEIGQMVEILLTEGEANSVLFTGQAGVGKTALMEAFAERINKGDVPPDMNDAYLLELNIQKLVSGTAYRGQFEARVVKLLEEIDHLGEAEKKQHWFYEHSQWFKDNGPELKDAVNPFQLKKFYEAYKAWQWNENFWTAMDDMMTEAEKRANGRMIVLFIDEIHSTVNAGATKEGGGNLWQFLKPRMSRGKLRVVGATTTQEKHIFLDSDEALRARFKEIVLTEPPRDIVVEKITPSQIKKNMKAREAKNPWFSREYFDVKGDFYDLLYDVAPKYFRGGRPRVTNMMLHSFLNHQYLKWWEDNKTEIKRLEEEIAAYKIELMQKTFKTASGVAKEFLEFKRQKIAEFQARQKARKIVIDRAALEEYATKKLIPQEIADVQSDVRRLTQEIRRTLQAENDQIGFDEQEFFKLNSVIFDNEVERYQHVKNALEKIQSLLSATTFRTREQREQVYAIMRYMFAKGDVTQAEYHIFEAQFRLVTDQPTDPSQTPHAAPKNIPIAQETDAKLRTALQKIGFNYDRVKSQLVDVYYPADGERTYTARQGRFAEKVLEVETYIDAEMAKGTPVATIRSHVQRMLDHAIAQNLDEKYPEGTQEPKSQEEQAFELLKTGIDDFYTQYSDVVQRRRNAESIYQALEQSLRDNAYGQEMLAKVLTMHTKIIADTNLQYSELDVYSFRLSVLKKMTEILSDPDKLELSDIELQEEMRKHLRDNSSEFVKVKSGQDRTLASSEIKAKYAGIIQTVNDTLMPMVTAERTRRKK